MRKRYAQHFIALLVLAVLGAINVKYRPSYINDPDRFYHFSVSRQMKETSKLYLKEIPQIKGIHWDEYFPDKEFLFHQFTGIGYRIGGENGTVVTIWLLALAAIFILYLFAATQMSWWLALCLTASLTCWGYFVSRLTLLRPQVPAILFFTILLHGIYRRSPIHCMIATALMALSYHGVFIPFTPIAIAGITFLFFPENKKQEKSLILWSLSGLAIGILINPYFPSNLVLGWIHAQIPFLMKHDLSGVSFGSELYPFNTAVFKEAFVLPGIILLLAIFSLTKTTKDRRTQQDKILFTFTAAVFFLMALESPRAAEYWTPTSVFLASLLFTIWESKRIYAKGAIVLSLGFLALHLQQIFHSDPIEPNFSAEKIALETIGKDKQNAFIFNYEWDLTPYVLYYRPDLSFVDILDPSLLYFTDKNIFWARQKLLSLQIGDAYALQRNIFKADYAITKSPTNADALQRDPDFLEIYPGSQKQQAQFYVFKLRPNSSPNFMHEFYVSNMPNLTGKNFREKMPSDATPNPVHHTEDKSSYLELAAVYQKEFPKESLVADIKCARVDLDPKETKKFVGAEYFGIGGGRNIRVWRNGKPFYTSVNGFSYASRLNLLVHMSEPLSASDRFSIIACSAGNAPYWGVAASFWKKQEIEAICEEKHKVGGNIRPDPFDWQYTGITSESCLGPILIPNSTKLTHD